jgi:hypothetical protein
MYQLVRQRGVIAERDFEVAFLDPGVRAYVSRSADPPLDTGPGNDTQPEPAAESSTAASAPTDQTAFKDTSTRELATIARVPGAAAECLLTTRNEGAIP